PPRQKGSRPTPPPHHSCEHRNGLRSKRSLRRRRVVVTSFSGTLYDGRTTLRVPVCIEARDEDVIIDDAPATAHVPTGEIRADAPVPGVPRTLRLPGGETIETSDHAAVTALWPEQSVVARAAFALESRWWPPLAGLALTAVFAAFIVIVVLPLA